ncbi:MAG: CPBP family intramembrane metalloprotease [Planctomycetota bacterium]|nr:CPBP family intramembrane metalloprotease [Planctomycetota bacterium]
MSPPSGEPAPSGIRGLIRDLLGLNRGALAILASVPLVLTLLDYYGMPWHYPEYRERRPAMAAKELRRAPAPAAEYLDSIEVPGSERLKPWVWWISCCLTFLVLIPAVVARFLAGLRIRDLGLRVRGTGKDALTYLVLFALFFPVIWIVSRTEAFQDTYPFFALKPGEGITREFLIFELIYCLQFFAIEFFFRGYMVLGLKKSLGWASVLVMLAPYCMIHYYKPMPEALGAIAAGLVLGALSWRTGTILYGWALHFGVALSMDLLALQAKGLL